MESLLRERVEELVVGVRDRVWVPAERLAFGDYCERNIFIRGTENADYAGAYSRDVTPSVCRLMGEFFDGGDGERWRSCYGTKGSQSGLSMHALMGMVRKADYAPGNVVFGIDSQANARDMSERFTGFLRAAPSMESVVAAVSEDDLSGLKVSLPGMDCWFVGAGSVGQIASKPGVSLVVVDEVENHKVPKKDVETLGLFEARGKATISGKLLAFSKPTVEEGQIWRAVKRGSGHRDFLPCPHCEHFQYLRHQQLRWKHCRDESGELDLELIRAGAFYECEECGEAIGEESKEWMLRRGEVRATHYVEREVDGEKKMVPGWEPGVMSFYHSDLYARWEGSRWGDIAVALEVAGRDPSRLKSVYLDLLGIAWKEGGGKRVRLEDVTAMKRSFLRGTSPFKPRFVGMYADTQDDRWKAGLMAYSGEGDFALCDVGEFMTWENVKKFFVRGVEFEGKRYSAQVALVDEGGHRTWEVRQNCRRLYPKFHPSKGLGGVQTQGKDTVHWRKFDLFKTSGDCPQKVKVLNYDDDAYRAFLYRTLILDREKDEERTHGELMFFSDIDEGTLLELCHEYQVKKLGRWGWETDGPNDFGDVVKMGLIGFSAFGHRFR